MIIKVNTLKIFRESRLRAHLQLPFPVVVQDDNKYQQEAKGFKAYPLSYLFLTTVSL